MFLHTHNAICQRTSVVWFDVNVSNMAFVNYHKCHNHQKTTTDDLARTRVRHFYLYTFCSSTPSPPRLFMTHCTTPALYNYFFPSCVLCFMSFWKQTETCECVFFSSKSHMLHYLLRWEGTINILSLKWVTLQKVCTLSVSHKAAFHNRDVVCRNVMGSCDP